MNAGIFKLNVSGTIEMMLHIKPKPDVDTMYGQPIGVSSAGVMSGCTWPVKVLGHVVPMTYSILSLVTLHLD